MAVLTTIPTDSAILSWRQRLDRGAREQRRALVLCLGIGAALQLSVMGACLVIARLALDMGGSTPPHPYRFAAFVAIALCSLMLLVAMLTKPAGRAETARIVYESGLRAPQEHPVGAAGITLLALIALYGSYAIVEASGRIVMRFRLVRVDRDDVARILAAVMASPLGISWNTLTKIGQSAESLRGPLALLVLDGWVALADGGATLVPRSASKRRLSLRHPLAEAFDFSP